MNKYYIVVEEWNYPTESGREVIDDFDRLEDAIAKCQELISAETANFESNCGAGAEEDHPYALFLVSNEDPCFVYAARVIEVSPSFCK